MGRVINRCLGCGKVSRTLYCNQCAPPQNRSILADRLTAESVADVTLGNGKKTVFMGEQSFKPIRKKS